MKFVVPNKDKKHLDYVKSYLIKQKEKLVELENTKKLKKPVYDPKRNNVAVLVEARETDLIELVTRNIMYFLGADKWNLHIYCSNLNIDYIKKVLPGWDYKITNLGCDNITTNEHNMLLKEKSFWENISEENILIFQTDCLMFRSGIEQYLHFDFVGAPFLNPHALTPNDFGQNGGFSFRKRSAMLDAIDKVSLVKINDYRMSHEKKKDVIGMNPIQTLAEDIYFNHAMEILNKNVLSMREAMSFSIETPYDGQLYMYPLGTHAFDKNMFEMDFKKKIFEASDLHKFVNDETD